MKPKTPETFEEAAKEALLHNYYTEAMDTLDEHTKKFVESTSWAGELHRAAELKLEIAAIRQAADQYAAERVRKTLERLQGIDAELDDRIDSELAALNQGEKK